MSRGCGKLRYGRSFQYLKKENQCKKCKGLMLSLNEIQKMENSGIKRFNKMRIHKLGETLSSGTPGLLNCPKCSKKMVEIELAYNESHVAKYVEKPVHQYIPIPFVDMLVGGTILLAAAARDKYGENEVKTLTVDGCHHCNIFWFDKGELQIVSTQKNSEEN